MHAASATPVALLGGQRCYASPSYVASDERAAALKHISCLRADISVLQLLEDSPQMPAHRRGTPCKPLKRWLRSRLGNLSLDPATCGESIAQASRPQPRSTTCQGVTLSAGALVLPLTARPCLQGVLYSHRANFLHTFTMAMPDALSLSSATSIMAIVPLFHANAWGLVFGAPMFGSKLVLPGHTPAPVSGARANCLTHSLLLPASCWSACSSHVVHVWGAKIEAQAWCFRARTGMQG